MLKKLVLVGVVSVALAQPVTVTVQPQADSKVISVSEAQAAPQYVEDCCFEDGWRLCCYVMEFMDSIGWE